MEFSNSGPVTALIYAGFGFLSAVVSVYIERTVQKKRRPKDRIEAALDLYEAVVRDMKTVSDAQSQQLQIAAKENERLHEVITNLQFQLRQSNAQILALETQIKGLRNVTFETQ